MSKLELTPHKSVRNPDFARRNIIAVEKRELTREVPSAESKNAWKKPAARYTRGVLAKYAAHVASASLEAVTDMNLKL